MNLPNRLSLIRIACVPVVVVLILMDNMPGMNIAALVLFCFASFTDYLDGHIARKHGLVTNFGKFLDPVADKLLVISTMVALCGIGYLPAWAVVIVLFRELAVDGLRLVAVEQGHVIAAGKLGKIKTITQIAMLITYQLWVCGWEQMQPFSSLLLLAAMAMTLWSGLDYFLKNREVLHG